MKFETTHQHKYNSRNFRFRGHQTADGTTSRVCNPNNTNYPQIAKAPERDNVTSSELDEVKCKLNFDSIVIDEQGSCQQKKRVIQPRVKASQLR